MHFEVWICDYFDETQSKLDRNEPLVCCHYEGYPSSQDGVEIYKWLRFEVEDYEFEITDRYEYHLFVKLVDLPLVGPQGSEKISSRFTTYPYSGDDD